MLPFLTTLWGSISGGAFTVGSMALNVVLFLWLRLRHVNNELESHKVFNKNLIKLTDQLNEVTQKYERIRDNSLLSSDLLRDDVQNQGYVLPPAGTT